MEIVQKQKRVAIIGVGINGVCMLRRLSTNSSYELTAFERNFDIGGIWLYTDQTSSGDYGQAIVNPVYHYMRTNLPKQLMELEGFPTKNYPSFPSHREILAYIKNVADTCDIKKFIKFNTEVLSVKPDNQSTKSSKWLITYKDIRKPDNQHTDEFDAVVVSNGNCRIPQYPKVAGEGRFKGLVKHSLYYRRPEFYRGQTVAILGASHSGLDISFDLHKYAKQVYLCHKGKSLETKLPPSIIEKVACFKEFTESAVILEDGEELFIDSVIYCTGYLYDYSFLPQTIVEISENNMVCNLFKYSVSIDYPNLFFMGVLRNGSFFLTAENTAKFIAAVLDGTNRLPDLTQAKEIVREDSKKDIYDRWIYLIEELSEFTPCIQKIPLVLTKIWRNQGNIVKTDFLNSKSISYKITGKDSFVTV